jgi:hypothetical protein
MAKVITKITTIYNTVTQEIEVYKDVVEELDENEQPIRNLGVEKTISDLLKEIQEGEVNA